MNLSIKRKVEGCGRRFGRGRLVLRIGGRLVSKIGEIWDW